MNILLVSQCDKRALTETRRILDQFAERRGCPYVADPHYSRWSEHVASPTAQDRTQEHCRGLPLDTRAEPQ